MPQQLRSGADLNNQKVINLGSPTNGTDGANKQYVDNVAAGLDVKNSVRVASTTNLTLTGTQTIDGVSVVAGDRVLVKDQTTASANGLYVVASGAWARSADGTQGNLTPGALVIVEEGSVNADTIWLLTTDGTVTVGTTAITFTRFQAGITYTFGAGLTVSANAVSVNAGTGLIADGTSLRIDPSYVSLAKRYAVTTTGTTSTLSVTHGLGTRDINKPTVWDVTNSGAWVPIECDISNTDANTVTLSLGVVPTSGQYRVVITA